MDNSISIRTDKLEKAVQITRESIDEYNKAYKDVTKQLERYELNIKDDISNSAREYLSNANKAIVQSVEKLSQTNDNLKDANEALKNFENRGLKL